MNHSGPFGQAVPGVSVHPGREAGGQHLNAAAYGYDQYQAMTSTANNMSVSSTPGSTPNAHNYNIEGDVPMEDADPYNRTKYPSRPAPHQRSSSQYIPHEGSAAAQRYSPMNMVNAAGQFTSSPKPQSQSQTGYTYQGQTPRSRQSPTRQNHFGSPQQYQDSPSKLNSRILTWPITWLIYRRFVASARYNPSFVPSIQGTDMTSDQYYANLPMDQLSGARNGKSQMGIRPQNISFGPTPGAGAVPRFQKIKSVQELQPRINFQPPFRRANPEGGFISVCYSQSVIVRCC